MLDTYYQQGSALPILSLDKPGESARFRIIEGPANTKYADFGKVWTHSPPRNLQKHFGGYTTIRCAGLRSGCIFHDGPFDQWSAKENTRAQYPINVLVYEQDKYGSFTGKRSMQIWVPGKRALDGLVGVLDASKMKERMCSVDIVLTRFGEGTGTQYIPTLQTPFEAVIDWSSVTPPNKDYADDQFPQLIDYEKFPGFEILDPAGQQAFLERRIAMGSKGADSDAVLQGGNAGGYGAPAQANFGTMWTPHGAPPSSQFSGFQGAAPMSNLPPFGAPQQAPQVDYNAIKALPDPWGKGMSFGQLDRPTLEFIVATAGFTPEQVNAANALLNEPPAAPAAPPAFSAPQPPGFGAPATPAAPASFGAPAAAPAAPPAFGGGMSNQPPSFGAPGFGSTASQPAPAGMPSFGAPAAAAPQPPAFSVPAGISPLAQQVQQQMAQSPSFAQFGNVQKICRFYGKQSLAEFDDAFLEHLKTNLLDKGEAFIVQSLAQIA